MGKPKVRPEWVPPFGGDEFASSVLEPASVSDSNYNFLKTVPKNISKKTELTISDYVREIRSGSRTILAKAITLIESNSHKHKEKAAKLLNELLPFSGNSIRIGITGAPGAGKSTFIETFGTYLCSLGHKLAVLVIDPSSNRSKGSILGDKTRMEELTRNDNAFIRPSPSGGTLGGVAAKTRESIIVCEAAGYDVILIETIGVGQSEIAARSMVDFFLLILLPGEGDELQGIKKGSVELSDLIVINKADGDNIQLAEITRHHYELALHYTLPATDGWNTPVLTSSAKEGRGFEDIWNSVLEYEKNTKKNGNFQKRRNEQALDYFKTYLSDMIRENFYSHPEIKSNLKTFEQSVLNGKLNASLAAQKIFELFKKGSS